jgi:Rad3-related DNA helicase
MISKFPKNFTPREIQVKAIMAIDAAVKAGKKFIVLEAPVGCGKSQISMTVSNWSQDAYCIMPRKNLQAQYQQTFEGDVRLVSGRASQPCTYGDPVLNKKVIPLIKSGGHVAHPELSKSCATAPCMNVRPPKRKQVLDDCSQSGACPYATMLEEACKHDVIVANNHSFFYGGANGNLPKRKVLVIDEAHSLLPMLRDMMKVSFIIYRNVLETDLIGLKTPQQFVNWLKFDEQFLTLPNDKREEYLAKLEKFEKSGEAVFGKQAIVKVIQDRSKTTFEFTPSYVGGAAHSFFFDYADIVVLMSGTIYDVAQFCNPLGLKLEDASYTRLASDFPAANRPVVRPRNKTLDLSHKGWDINVAQAVATVKSIMTHHKGDKGLIHAPNYRLAQQLYTMLYDTGRVVTHTPENFTQQLQMFYASKEPLVLISPSVREGVDFSHSRARFQCLMRPPYAPADDPYNKWLIHNGRWDLYYRQALIEFGQILGRPVRSKEDFGTSYLISSTFDKFLTKIWSQLPQWQRDAFVA